MASDYVPHRDPTFSERISTTVSRNAPTVVGKFIFLVVIGFVIVFRFVRDMFLEAIGKK